MEINYNQPTLTFNGRYDIKNYIGCLKGGAIGDALGNPVEFRRLSEIKSIFGDKGIDTFILNKKNVAEITDDTQMTMFTADGLMKSLVDNFDLKRMPNMETVFDSYKLWYNTQISNVVQTGKGWISGLKELYARRAPGLTCTSSIDRGIPGSMEKALNNSAGCGGVMRVAPAGLLYKDNPELAFKVGAECAALTHGSPNAYLPAGFHSSMIAYIINGNNIEQAFDKSMKILDKYPNNEKVKYLLEEAKTLSKMDINPEYAIEVLGEGWHGDEAIAIASYCVLKEPNNFKKAVTMAVNHSGDSDSTGSIVGNILGAHLGLSEISKEWQQKVELSKELDILASDLYNKTKNSNKMNKRYTKV